MEHPFFSDINWTDLGRKRITPPFKPEVTKTTLGETVSYYINEVLVSKPIQFQLRDELDTRYVDQEFQHEDVTLTPPSCHLAAGQTMASAAGWVWSN